MVVMTYQYEYEDACSSKWTFNIEAGTYEDGEPYIDIVGVSLGGTSIPFDVLDRGWINRQEEHIERRLG